jgi:metallophosphoesterase (TIGR00282 family)
MKIAFIGDIVGRPGRKMVKQKLPTLIKKYNIDFTIANGENASHGFGITVKNAKELFNCGVDLLTGGNHSWDKKNDFAQLFEDGATLRPDNYPQEVLGSGVKIVEIDGTKLAIINLMGLMYMPQVLNPFTHSLKLVKKLQDDKIKHIFIDFHAELTAEKRILMQLLKGQVSAICGTHTHIGTDDLEITNDTFYVTDVGLTGCRDNVIGMDNKTPISKALTGVSGHFDIPNSCKSVMQIIVLTLDKNGNCKDALKIKLYDDKNDVFSYPLV